jgi:hypothetical protein
MQAHAPVKQVVVLRTGCSDTLKTLATHLCDISDQARAQGGGVQVSTALHGTRSHVSRTKEKTPREAGRRSFLPGHFLMFRDPFDRLRYAPENPYVYHMCSTHATTTWWMSAPEGVDKSRPQDLYRLQVPLWRTPIATATTAAPYTHRQSGVNNAPPRRQRRYMCVCVCVCVARTGG